MFLWFVALTLTGYVGPARASLGEEDTYSLTIQMPNVTSDRVDALMCTARQLGPEEAYIEEIPYFNRHDDDYQQRDVIYIRFTPHASKETSHHMMFYGCREPSNHSPSWVCDKAEEENSPNHDAVCQDDPRQILFAWALDAVGRSLPEGVGLRISGDTQIRYLVVQMHYSTAFSRTTDSSGYTIQLTRKRPAQQAGYFVLGNWGEIPPHQPGFHMDSACQWPLNTTIYPLAYRTHAHNLGVVISGYRVRDGKWLEIGRNSPQLPQAFYDVSQPGMDIRPGDILASRCIMDSMSRDNVTRIGHTNHDEMCNFYIMYSTYEQGNLENIVCFQDSNTKALLEDFPPESGSLDGIPGADEVKEKFHMT